MIRLGVALQLVAGVAIVFLAGVVVGRWTKHCDPLPIPAVYQQDTTGFFEEHVTPPRGPAVAPTRQTAAVDPPPIHLAGCTSNAATPLPPHFPQVGGPATPLEGDASTATPGASPPEPPGIQSILSIQLRHDELDVTRLAAPGLVISSLHPLRPYGNRLSVVAREGVPLVVDDPWARLRGVEVVFGGAVAGGDAMAIAALKAPVTRSLSVLAGPTLGGKGRGVWFGAAWRPFTRWP